MQKHIMKAGITGLAQVNGLRGDTDLNLRIHYDLEYIQNWSLKLDFKIIIMTAFNFFNSEMRIKHRYLSCFDVIILAIDKS